jgi:hypothetical protein
MAGSRKDSGVGPTGYWPVDCLEVQLAEEDPGSMAEIPGAQDPDQGMVHEMNCCLTILERRNHIMRVNPVLPMASKGVNGAGNRSST